MAHSAGRSRGAAMLQAAAMVSPALPKSSGVCLQPAIDDQEEDAAGANGQSTPAKPVPAHARSRPLAQDSPAQAAQPVPSHLRPLLDAFDALLTGRSLLKRRGERITYQALAPVVEMSTGRAFKVSLLQQIKTIWPDAFSWQYIRAPSLQDASRIEFQLLLTFEVACPASTEDSGTGAQRDAAARAEFRKRVAAWQLPAQRAQHPVDAACDASPGLAPPHAVSLTELPPREGAPRIGGSPTPLRPSASQGYAISPVTGTRPRLGVSPAPSGRPPPSPTVHTTRTRAEPGSGSRGMLHTGHGAGGMGTARRGSILEALNAQASGPPDAPLAPIMSESASAVAVAEIGTPTSVRSKRKAAALGEASTHGSPAAGGEAASPGDSTRSRALPRRRLDLADAALGASAGALAAPAQGGPDITPSRRPPPRPPQRAAAERACSQAVAASEVCGMVQGDPVQPPGAMTPPGAATPASVSRGPPSTGSKARKPLLARFMSEEAIQELRRNSETLAPGAAAAAAAAAAHAHAAALMPAAMDLLRAVFGPKGAALRPRDEVVELMRQKSSLSSGMSSAEAGLALDLIVQHAPEFVAYEQQDGVQVLRMSRAVNVKAVRDRLKAVALSGVGRDDCISTGAAQLQHV